MVELIMEHRQVLSLVNNYYTEVIIVLGVGRYLEMLSVHSFFPSSAVEEQ